jgi:hypothetical protein
MTERPTRSDDEERTPGTARQSGRRLTSAALDAAAGLAGRLGKTVGDEAGRIAGRVVDQAAAQVAAGLQPMRDLGRAVETGRVSVEQGLSSAALTATSRIKRVAVGAGLHGANIAGAAGHAAVSVLLESTRLLDTPAKFVEIRREIAEALARYDALLAEAAQAERERMAAEAVARLQRLDHRRTIHHASAYLHVSTGPGRTEAWGMILRGPHAGRSLASLAPEALDELAVQAPDTETAAALAAWRQVVERA